MKYLHRSRHFLCLFFFLFSFLTLRGELGQEMSKGWESRISQSSAKAQAVQHWRDMGFGIFIHWTPQAVFQGRAQGKENNKDLWGEWYMARTGISIRDYEKRVKTWNPQKFDADKWAKLFKASGAKYVIFVAKHHDGFALFNSAANNYNITQYTPFHRDPFKELSVALKQENLPCGFYYSHSVDWRNKTLFKGSKTEIEDQYWDKIVYKQLDELMHGYGKQSIAWFDLGAEKERAKKCVELVKKVNPSIMISSRVGGGVGDFSLGGDCEIPLKKVDKPWETCMTIDWHWAWYPEDRADKSAKQIITMLAKIRARGGNLLLNVGPDVRGEIPLRECVVFTEIGQWLKTNGDSIYGVHLTPYNDLPWGVCTTKKGKIFMHLFKLPRLDYLFLPGLKSPLKKAYLLADKKKTPLPIKKVKYGYTIDLSRADYRLFDSRDTVVVGEFSGKLEVDPSPVLDTDLKNFFIPALGRCEGGVVSRKTRVTSKPDHPGVEAPHYFYYACNFNSEKSRVVWKCIIPSDSTYFAKVKYANFTDKSITAYVMIGGKKLKLTLPPTPKKTFACIQSTLSQAVEVKANENATISFFLDVTSLKLPINTPAMRGLPKFMLESVEISTVLPPLMCLKKDINLSGGLSFTLRVQPHIGQNGEKSSRHPNCVQQAIQTVEKRLNEIGVADLKIKAQGKNRILVEIPGISPEEAKRIRAILVK